jgi:uncharacterized protein YjbI with pentapeptide repeats/tetratricopeptide (TPR) repeat protein
MIGDMLMSENEKKQPEKKSYRKANLKGKSLRGEDLRGLDFRKARLKGADLTGADLSEADLSGADLSQAILVDVKAVKTNWTGANFDKTRLKNFVTEDADFTKAGFRQIQAEGWTDTGSRFTRASMSKCGIDKSTFHQSQLSDVEFFRGRFQECKFKKCDMKSLKSPAARFEKCEFDGCEAESADFLSVFFTGSKIKDCSFASADMAGMLSAETSWTGCDFRRAELTTAEFKSSAFDSCKYEKANFRYVSGLDEQMLNEIKAGGGKVSRYLLKRLLKWILGTNTGRIGFVVVALIATLITLNNVRNPARWSQNKIWDRLHEAEQQDRLDDAMLYYNVLVNKLDSKDDQLVSAKIGLARLKERVGADDEALALLEEVLHDDLILPHERIQALSQRTSIDIRLGRSDRVIKVADELFETTENPESLINAYRTIIGQLVPQKKFDMIITLINMALDKYSENDELKLEMLLLRAQSLVNSDMIDESIADFTALLEKSPSDIQMREALSGLGQAYRSKGDLERSRQYYSKVAELFPNQVENVFMARMDEAQAMRAMNRHAEAIEQIEKIIEDAPAGDIKTRARITLANLLMDRRRFDEAISLLNESINDVQKGGATWIEAMISKAQISKHKGETDEAISILDGVLKEDIDRSFVQWARSLRADFLAQADRIEEAIDDVKKLLKDSSDAGMRTSNGLQLARLYSRSENWIAVLKILGDMENSQMNRETKEEIFAMKINIFDRTGKSEKAIALADEMDEGTQDPHLKLTAKIYKIELYWSQGDRENTEKVLDEILAMKKPRHEMPNNLLRLPGLQLDEKLKEKVLKIFLELEKLPGEDQVAFGQWQNMLTVGHLYREMGNFEEAKKRYQAVFQEAKDHHMRLQSAENLGLLYTENDMLEEGVKVFQDIIDNWPESTQAQVTGLVGLANIARRNTEFEKAVSMLGKAEKVCVDDMDCCRVISDKAQIFRESGQEKELKALYEMVLEKHQNCWVFQEAEEYLQKKDSQQIP